MKKNILLFTVLFSVITFYGCKKEVKPTITEKPQKCGFVINKQLSANDYIEVKGYKPSEGLIPTADLAFEIAEPVLKNIYGINQIESEKPFSINLENDIWIIEGNLKVGLLGGVAYMEIRKSNAEILKVIHTK